jgi:DNA-binding MarR family transcriptional regulator
VKEIRETTQQEPGALLTGVLRMGHIMEQQLDAALQPHGLSLAKLNVLQSLVWAEEPVPLGALSERLGCVNSNITKLIDRLEADKLVQRLPDPEDRRSKLAAITEEGRSRCRAGRHALEQAERAILESFSAGDREALAHVSGYFRGG